MENKINYEMCLKKYYAALSPNTGFVYKLALNDFLKFMNIGMNEIINISKTDIIRYAAELEKKYSNNSFRSKIMALRNLMLELEKINKNFISPFNTLSKIEKHLLRKDIKRKINQDDLLREPEIEKILNHFSDKFKQSDNIKFFQIHLIFNFLIKTGLKVSELINAKKNNVINNNGVYYLRIIDKNDKERSVIIPDNTYKMLCIYNQLINNQTEYLITMPINKKLDRQKVFNIIQKTGNKILNKSISPSTLRHTFAVYYLIKKKFFCQQFVNI
ncbi:MAG TPA: tyrosine-type recombinase/integrase [bacterium]|nr:tyrosine-type recombinase/integrase [bacterium]